MKCSGHQGALHAQLCERLEIGGIANAACRIERGMGRFPTYRTQARQVRAAARADTSKGHGDEVLGPERRGVPEVGRSHEAVAPEIQRQHREMFGAGETWMGQQVGILQ